MALLPNGEAAKVETVFDASQYAFFGNNIVEEIELGGLEEEEQADHEDSPTADWDFTEEDEILHSNIDHLEHIFIESKTDNGLRSTDGFAHPGSRESSSAAEFAAHEECFPNRFPQQIPVNSTEHPSSQHSNHLLHRASSYPDPHLPSQTPKSPFPSYPPPGVSHSPNSGAIFGTPPRNIPPFSHTHLPQGPSFYPISLVRPPTNQWLQQNGMFRGDHSTLVHNFLNQRPSSPNSPILNFHPQQPTFSQIPVMPVPNHSHPKPSGRSFRSKRMSSDELDAILRIQIAATHTNDPYVDDYYNQACLAKKNRNRRPFCPSHLGGARTQTEPHSFLQIDGLGRLPFSSVRRPRPLLEIEPFDQKPLEYEPMLAARAAVEDGFLVLLDIDDIDRFVQVSKPYGAALEGIFSRRLALLQGLAGSLRISDPLNANLDDLVFLKLASLRKGKKLVSEFIRRLVKVPDLDRIVLMAVFRHSRLFFDSHPSRELESAVSACLENMEGLGGLSACLAAVVCSSETPPFRPAGVENSHGASGVLKTLLDRAAAILMKGSENGRDRMVWEASFDEFFRVLTRYCFEKYDGIVGSVVGSEVGREMSREMPVELLRACLPHTKEEQRKVLLEFARRTIP